MVTVVRRDQLQDLQNGLRPSLLQQIQLAATLLQLLETGFEFLHRCLPLLLVSRRFDSRPAVRRMLRRLGLASVDPGQRENLPEDQMITIGQMNREFIRWFREMYSSTTRPPRDVFMKEIYTKLGEPINGGWTGMKVASSHGNGYN